MAYCCGYMQENLEQSCPDGHDQWTCPDRLIHRKNEVYGLIIHDGGTSYDRIQFCPWCGSDLSKFPEPAGES